MNNECLSLFCLPVFVNNLSDEDHHKIRILFIQLPKLHPPRVIHHHTMSIKIVYRRIIALWLLTRGYARWWMQIYQNYAKIVEGRDLGTYTSVVHLTTYNNWVCQQRLRISQLIRCSWWYKLYMYVETCT